MRSVSEAQRTDERVRSRRSWYRALSRPAAGAVITTIIALLVFTWPLWECLGDSQACLAKGFLTPRGISNWLEVGAQVGILAAAVTLLMIAGEFDLSIGSMIGAAGMVLALGMSQFGLDPWLAIVVAFAFAMAVGFLNGWLVVRTGLPSFIVTLGMLFLLRGVTIGTTRFITGRTQVGGLREITDGDALVQLFAGDVVVGDFHLPASIFWWLLVTGMAWWVLTRTTFGNWIFGTGGNETAARNVGVPVRGVKIALFMTTAASAALLACIQVFTVASADVLRGEQKELGGHRRLGHRWDAADGRLRVAHRCLLWGPHPGHDEGRHPPGGSCLGLVPGYPWHRPPRRGAPRQRVRQRGTGVALMTTTPTVPAPGDVTATPLIEARG